MFRIQDIHTFFFSHRLPVFFFCFFPLQRKDLVPVHIRESVRLHTRTNVKKVKTKRTKRKKYIRETVLHHLQQESSFVSLSLWRRVVAAAAAATAAATLAVGSVVPFCIFVSSGVGPPTARHRYPEDRRQYGEGRH